MWMIFLWPSIYIHKLVKCRNYYVLVPWMNFDKSFSSVSLFVTCAHVFYFLIFFVFVLLTRVISSFPLQSYAMGVCLIVLQRTSLCILHKPPALFVICVVYSHCCIHCMTFFRHWILSNVHCKRKEQWYLCSNLFHVID